jgi:response regulator RpfG family c-di-GMP phosphodiesterase
MDEKILFIDDEENVLSAFRRQFKKLFSLDTASNAKQGLDLLQSQGPFAVVIADFRMPEMDGIQFLSRVKDVAPDTVRIMLTGHADLSTAIDAVNSGNIFRFLTKPCPVEILMNTIQMGLQQYRLINAERELLEKTLNRSVRLLTEVLSLANPTAFNRTLNIRRISSHIARQLRLADAWQIELAAMLSQMGCMVLPPGLLERVNTGKTISFSEQSMYSSHPFIGHRLLQNIPRLEPIAVMVKDQQKRYSEYNSPNAPISETKTNLGAQILKVAIDYDRLILSEFSHTDAIAILQGRDGEYNPKLVKALGEGVLPDEGLTVKIVDINGLANGMILDEDIFAKDGSMLFNKHQEVTQAVIERLRLIQNEKGIVEPFRVFGTPNREDTGDQSAGK